MALIFALYFFIPTVVVYSLFSLLLLTLMKKHITIISLGVFIGSGIVCGFIAIFLYGIIIAREYGSLNSTSAIIGMFFTGGVSAIFDSLFAIKILDILVSVYLTLSGKQLREVAFVAAIGAICVSALFGGLVYVGFLRPISVDDLYGTYMTNTERGPVRLEILEPRQYKMFSMPDNQEINAGSWELEATQDGTVVITFNRFMSTRSDRKGYWIVSPERLWGNVAFCIVDDYCYLKVWP